MKPRHFEPGASIEMPEIEKAIEETVRKLEVILKEAESKHETLLDEDNLRDTLADLFEGHVGPPDAESEHDELKKRADDRYRRRIPPGYRDAEKEGDEKYGDIVLWFQLIKHAKSAKRPLIFVTSDEKEDWWLRQRHRTMGPRPELIREMTSEASVSFYMYLPDLFMELSERELELAAGEAVKEVREIRQRDRDIRGFLGAIAEQEEERRRVMQKVFELEPERMAAARGALGRAAEMEQQIRRSLSELARAPSLEIPPLLRDILVRASRQHEEGEARPATEKPREEKREGDEAKGGG